MLIEKIKSENVPAEFLLWLTDLENAGYSYEVVVNAGYITHVYVNKPLQGNGFGDIYFGRVIGSKHMRITQETYKPVLINRKFVKNLDDDPKRQKRTGGGKVTYFD